MLGSASQAPETSDQAVQPHSTSTISSHNPITQLDVDSSFESLSSDDDSLRRNKIDIGSSRCSADPAGTVGRRISDRVKSLLYLGSGDSRKSAPTYSGLDHLIKPLDDYPLGYPQLAAMEASDPDFLIFRKFSELHIRVLLYHQDELAQLEETLAILDRSDLCGDFRKLKSRRRDFAIDSSRKNLILGIEKELSVYDDLLLRYQQVHAIRRPRRRDQNSVYNYLSSERPLVPSEAEWIHHSADLAALDGDHDHGWFPGFVEDVLLKISSTATLAIFRTKEQHLKSGHAGVFLISRNRINTLIRILITPIMIAALLFPVFVLYAAIVKNRMFQLLIIYASTLTFTTCGFVFTEARKTEVFGAAAAFCTVLVLLVANTQ